MLDEIIKYFNILIKTTKFSHNIDIKEKQRISIQIIYTIIFYIFVYGKNKEKIKKILRHKNAYNASGAFVLIL